MMNGAALFVRYSLLAVCLAICFTGAASGGSLSAARLIFGDSPQVGNQITVSSGTRNSQTIVAYILNGNFGMFRVEMSKISSASGRQVAGDLTLHRGSRLGSVPLPIPECRASLHRIPMIGFW